MRDIDENTTDEEMEAIIKEWQEGISEWLTG